MWLILIIILCALAAGGGLTLLAFYAAIISGERDRKAFEQMALDSLQYPAEMTGRRWPAIR